MSNIYMHAQGINGSVSAQAYKNWILIHSLHFATSKTVHTKVGRGNNQEKLRLNYSELQITYIGKDSAHDAQSPNVVGYNLETAELS